MPEKLADWGVVGVRGGRLVLAAVAVGGNGLKIREGLSAASVNILMALMLLAVLGWGGARRSAASR